MVNFVDEYPRQLDERGRIHLASPKLEKICPETVYVTRSMSDKCLQLYTQEEWDKISTEKINQLPTATDRNAAAFCTFVFGKATSAVIDKQRQSANRKASDGIC